MKTKILIAVAAMVLCSFVSSCVREKDFEDRVKEIVQLDSLNARMAVLETQMKGVNTDIATLKTAVEALQKNLYVTKVETTTDGFKLTFSNGTSVEVKNGKDGKDGTDGKAAPVVGVKDSLGIYYWVLVNKTKTPPDTSWILDKELKKIPVSGKDGAEVGVKDTLSSVYWVKIDKSKSPADTTWLMDKDSNLVQAVGKDGESIFSGIDTTKTGYVVLTLASGTKIELPYKAELDKLVARIQKIDVIPDYNDGSVGIGKGDFEFSFIIRPDSVAQKVADSIELFKLLATRTLTKSSVQVDTIALKGVSYEKGIVTVTIDGSKFPAEMLDSTRSHSGCLVISDGNSETTSGFFPMTQVRYPEFRDLVCMYVKGTWWATVNCGYKPATEEDLSDGYVYGKLYQFGRAKGCGYGEKWGDDTKGPETVIQTFIESTTANPDDDKFYQGGGDDLDWYFGTKLPGWPMKSGDAGYLAGKIDNPCPSGWRVPIEAELDTLLGGNDEPPLATAGGLYGAYFNGTPNPENTGVFLPFAGLRQGDSDNFNGRSSESCYGVYWSSKAKSLGIGEGYVYWGEDGDRAYGYSVRCVRE